MKRILVHVADGLYGAAGAMFGTTAWAVGKVAGSPTPGKASFGVVLAGFLSAPVTVPLLLMGATIDVVGELKGTREEMAKG